MLLVEESGCLAIFQVKEIRKVYRKLMKRFGEKLAVSTDLSSYHPTEDEPYPRETLAETEQDTGDSDQEDFASGEQRNVDQEISMANSEADDVEEEHIDEAGEDMSVQILIEGSANSNGIADENAENVAQGGATEEEPENADGTDALVGEPDDIGQTDSMIEAKKNDVQEEITNQENKMPASASADCDAHNNAEFAENFYKPDLEDVTVDETEGADQGNEQSKE